MAHFNKEKALATIKSGDMDDIQALLDDLEERLNTKKYGLVWERGGNDEDSAFEAEYVVVDFETKMPYAKTRLDLSLNPERSHGNLLLEGDNYIWLKILEQTHAGRIDVIYIDPPYGTDQKAGKDTGFCYNDRFVDPDDTFKNSKWLDFMFKRLLSSRALLKEGGLVFISVDQNHQADTEYLCNEVFGVKNKLCNIAVVNNLKGRSDDAFFATAHEHLICYTNNKSEATIYGFALTDEQAAEYKLKDEKSRYKLVGLKKTGKGCYREDRQNMFYPVYYNPSTNDFSLEYADGYVEIIPYINGREGRWRWGREKFLANKDTELVAKQQKGEWVVYVKMRDLVDGKPRTARPKSIWINPSYDSGNGTDENKTIFGDKVFNNPKPLAYMMDILRVSAPPNAIILDFFAGSGSTAHAVELLNKEDGGCRSWIMATNNEDMNEDDNNPDTGICRDITKPRIDTAITGIKPDGTRYSDGTDSGYQYFQYDFIPRFESREANKRAFFTPTKNIDAIVRIKYGVVLKELDRDRMAMIYESDNKQLIVFIKDVDDELLEEFFDDEHERHIVLANDIVDVDGIESDTIHSLIPSYEFFM